MFKFVGKVVMAFVVVSLMVMGCSVILVDEAVEDFNEQQEREVSYSELDKSVGEALEESEESNDVEYEEVENVLNVISFEHTDADKEWEYTYVSLTLENTTDKEVSWLDYSVYATLKDGSRVQFNGGDDILPNGKTIIEVSVGTYYTPEDIVGIEVYYEKG